MHVLQTSQILIDEKAKTLDGWIEFAKRDGLNASRTTRIALARLIRSSQPHFSNMKRRFKLELGTELHTAFPYSVMFFRAYQKNVICVEL